MGFKNLRLAIKQGLAFSFILVIMAGVTVFSLIKMSTLKNEIDEVNRNWLPSIITVAEINLNIAQYRISELQHAFTYSGYKQREQEQTLLSMADRIEKGKELYESLISSPEEQRIYSDFQEKWRTYLERHEQFMKLLQDNKNDDAIRLINGESLKLFNDVSKDMRELVKVNKNGSFEAARWAEDTYTFTSSITTSLLALTMLLSMLIALVLVRTITEPIKQLEEAAENVSKGNMNVRLDIRAGGEIANLARSFDRMTNSLREIKEENERQDWFKTGLNELNENMRGDQYLLRLARNVITCLSKYLGAQIGALYIVDEENAELKLTGSYAFTKRKSLSGTIKIGEGLAGQAAFEREMISVTNIPEDYIRIKSALGNTLPRNIVVSPFIYEGELLGVVELASFEEFADIKLEFIERSMENIAIGIHSAQAGGKIKYLLRESQQQAETLQAQQQKLKAANEELSAQRDALKDSEAKLLEQQEELQAANEELEEKTQYLEKQKEEIMNKNRELEAARKDIEQQARELEVSSKYKSEFLANMSHELRTPLNSMLILARNMADNKEGNLSQDQVKSSEIIHKSGNNLLTLINEILDLSKIEAGKMTTTIETGQLSELATNIRTDFNHVAQEKGLALHIELADDLPKTMDTDWQRLEQIIRNFMSNAFKFTEKGSIRFDIRRSGQEDNLSRSGLDVQDSIVFLVSDTGIGIPKEKLLDIFEAFQQVDGSTSRKYGGTGLGLSISRELAKLLGGEIQLESEEGKGSTFALFLPEKTAHQEAEIRTLKLGHEKEDLHARYFNSPVPKPRDPVLIPDDRKNMNPGDKVILIIEDDPDFAEILIRQCHEKGFKGLVCDTGEEGLGIAEKHQPMAILLDIRLPGINGWMVLDSLKDNPKTRHIPVHIMSAEEATIDAFKKGAIGFLTKPVRNEDMESAFLDLEAFIEKKMKDLLVVEDDDTLRKSIRRLIGNDDVSTTEATNAAQAVEALKNKKFDCMILDLNLPDMTGFELLSRLRKEKTTKIPPIIVYTANDLTPEQEEQLQKYSDSIIIKGVRSGERLLDEATLFLHRIVSKMPQRNQDVIKSLHNKDRMFSDKEILLVDDDMRNVFALSKMLREKGMKVLKAEDGKKALSLLDQEPTIDLVLMDIMMPVMDGYETIEKIRDQERFKNLPIIALTAKAMKEDKEKCIAAGASDYLTKPVDLDRLFSMMRVWLYR